MIQKYVYSWPHNDLNENKKWKKSDHAGFIERDMPENEFDLQNDSRWPGFFPSAICFVTTTDGECMALEKVVGATIVNRFPYILALSFCTKPLSSRHYVRKNFMKILEEGKTVAVQYFEPGINIDRIMNSINTEGDESIHNRIKETGLEWRKADTNECAVFKNAYLVYEARLMEKSKDFEGNVIFEKPYTDYGSHRIYYLEIEAIQLRKDISEGKSQILWKSLPSWKPIRDLQILRIENSKPDVDVKYQKGYTSQYLFPAKNTIGFEYDKISNDMAIKHLPPLPEDQIEVDNDKARWPCFFPSSVGLITTWGEDSLPNLMPCGSTSILIRHPLCFAICVSYAKINVRYAPRASLNSLLNIKKFICSVPFDNEIVINAIKYAGNISITEDNNKIQNAGLQYVDDKFGPLLSALPVSYRCNVVKVVRLGTHFLILGEVESILVRDDVTKDNSIQWHSYPDVIK